MTKAFELNHSGSIRGRNTITWHLNLYLADCPLARFLSGAGPIYPRRSKMGAGDSTLRLNHPFAELSEWSLHQVEEVYQDYKRRNLDFCVDASLISSLLGLDMLHARDIVTAFTGNPSGQLNFLSILAGMVVISCKDPSQQPSSSSSSSSPSSLSSSNRASLIQDKISLLFNLFDLGSRGYIAADELTILLLSMLRGVVIILGKGWEPTDGEIERYTIAIYKAAPLKTESSSSSTSSSSSSSSTSSASSAAAARRMGVTISKKAFVEASRQVLGSCLRGRCGRGLSDSISVEELLMAFHLLEARGASYLSSGSRSEGQEEGSEASSKNSYVCSTTTSSSSSTSKQEQQWPQRQHPSAVVHDLADSLVGTILGQAVAGISKR